MKLRRDWILLVVAVAAFGAAIALQMARDRSYPRDDRQKAQMLYVRSGAALKRITLAFDAVAADVYWIRAIQHYGGDRRSGPQAAIKYQLLYPLLDLTTTLDPYFNIAYRFGAIFLSEGFPGGPGRPDQSVALLRKAIVTMPLKWQYYHDVGFVYYWRLHDYQTAALWFQRAAAQPNAPNWLPPLAASMLSRGQDRVAARFLWQQVAKSEEAWLRRSAERALLQLQALDQIEQLESGDQPVFTAGGRAILLDRFDWETGAPARADRSDGHAVRHRSGQGTRPRVPEVAVVSDAGRAPAAPVSLDPFQLTILVMLGLAVGSFLNVCIHRIPRSQSLVRPPSRCPACEYQLRWFDNIPVASYAAILGRCRKCRTRISIRYPLVELATMALFVVHGEVFGWSALLVPRLLFACAMVVLFAIDLEHHLLPNVITLPGIAIGLISSDRPPPGPRRRAPRRRARRRRAVAHRRSVLSVFRARRHGRWRRQDARDDWGVSRLEARAHHAGPLIGRRLAHRPVRDRYQARRPEIRAALRHLSRARCPDGLAGRRTYRELVREFVLSLNMTQAGYAFLGLTAIVAALAGILAYAFVKLTAAARAATRASSSGGTETAFMAAAMQEALEQMRVQERAMKARAEASERLSGEIISSMTSGLMVVNQEGLVRTLNPAGQRLLGLPDGDWMRNHREVLTRSASLADVIDECLATKRPIVRRAIKMDRPGAGASHLGITVSPIRDGTGFAHGAICLFTDLSEVIDLEDQLRLKDSLARLGELTAGIAHEFRNGLATIHGYSRLLDLERVPGDFRPYVQGIRDEAEALGQVVTNFLNFAKPAELTLEPCRHRCHGGARGRRDTRRGAHARRRRDREGKFRRGRGGRSAPAAGVQQPVPQCPRSVRRGPAADRG